MSYELITVEKKYNDHPHVALVTLNRPKVLNALSVGLMKELVDALLELDHDKEVRAIILTGNEKAFAAGADIAEMASVNPVTLIQDNFFFAWEKLSLIATPVIAAVGGFALGGGCELAMSCDLMIAADNAKFGQPEINIGTIPGAGGTQRLTRAIGKAKAMELILTGDMIDAQKAYDWGLVSKVVPVENLLGEAFNLAKTIAEKAPFASRLAKESVNKSYEMTLHEGLLFERRNFFLTFSSEDQKEGMSAFVEKRKPNYTGK